MFYFDLQRFAGIKTVKNGTTVDGLPPATSSSLGGVMVGTGVSVDSQGRISVPTATATSDGLMTSTEKTKLSSVAAGAEVNVINTVKVNNSALSVINKAVNIDLTGYVQKDGSKVLSTNDYTTAEQSKLASIAAGAEVNKINIVKVNGTSLTPDSNRAVNITVPDISNKVDKVAGKGLSTEDFTTAYKNKLDTLTSGAGEANKINIVKVNGTSLTPDSNKAVNIDLTGKVDKVTGMGLSTNDYTTADKNKLASIVSGATKNSAGTNVSIANDGAINVATGSANTPGVLKVGSNLSVNNGTISLSSANVTNALGFTPVSVNTTYPVASATTDGIMSSTDKQKLDSVTSAAGTYLTKTDASNTYLGKNAKAASATTADSATSASSCTGNAATATRLATSKDFRVNLESTLVSSFDGSSHCTPGVKGTLGVANGGTGATVLSAITVGAATKASQDSDGKTINITYAPLNDPTFTGEVTAPTIKGLEDLQFHYYYRTSDGFHTFTGIKTFYTLNDTGGKSMLVTAGQALLLGSGEGATQAVISKDTADSLPGLTTDYLEGESTAIISDKYISFFTNTSSNTGSNKFAGSKQWIFGTNGETTMPGYINVPGIRCDTLTLTSALGTAYGGTGQTDLSKVTVGAATKASQDGNGKTITTTYAPLASPVFTGTAKAPNISLSGTATIPTATVTTKLTAASIGGDAVYTLVGSSGNGIALDRSGNNNNKVLSVNSLAYWDGRWQTTNNSSNLAYCNKGAFGTMATVNSPVPEANGGTGATKLSAVTVGAATKASQDGSGKTITSTYAPLASPTFTGEVSAPVIKSLEELQFHYINDAPYNSFTGIKTYYTHSNTAGKAMLVAAGQALILSSGEGGLLAISQHGTAESLPGLDDQYYSGESTAIMSDKKVCIFTNTNDFSNSYKWEFNMDGTTTLPGRIHAPRIQFDGGWVGIPENPITVTMVSGGATSTVTLSNSGNLLLSGSNRTFLFAGDSANSKFGKTSDQLTCRDGNLDRIPIWIMPQGGPKSPEDAEDTNSSEHMFLCADRSIHIYTNLQTVQGKQSNTDVSDMSAIPQKYLFSATGTFYAPIVRCGTLKLVNALSVANGGTGQTDLSKVTVGTASKLSPGKNIRVDLGSTLAVNFDGTDHITPGVKSILGVGNGGTGQDDLSKVTVGKANTLSTAQNIIASLGSSVAASFNGTSAVTVGTQGTLPVNKGGTGLTASPSMLTNLGSTVAANILAASPRPGITGTLGVANGGTGQTDLSKVTVGTANTAGSCTGNAATATKLKTSRDFRVDLSSTLACGFDGSDTCVPGVKGTLGLDHGGTNATNAAGARTQLGLGSLAVLNSVALGSNVTGILSTANGGTGTNNLANITVGAATKASQDGNGKTIASTYAPLASPVFTGTVKAPNVSLSGAATIPTITAANITGNAVHSPTVKGDLGWANKTTDGLQVVTKNSLAYWNGRYNSTSSNLEYCNQGAFGNMATVNSPVPVANGGTGQTVLSAVTVGTASKLSPGKNIRVDLGSTVAVNFDGTDHITPGVKNALGIGNGGTGATTAAAARTNLGIPNNLCWWAGAATYSNNATLKVKIANVGDNALNIVNGTTIVVKFPDCTGSTITTTAYLNVNGRVDAIYGNKTNNSTGTIAVNKLHAGYALMIFQGSWVIPNYTI